MAWFPSTRGVYHWLDLNLNNFKSNQNSTAWWNSLWRLPKWKRSQFQHKIGLKLNLDYFKSNQNSRSWWNSLWRLPKWKRSQFQHKTGLNLNLDYFKIQPKLYSMVKFTLKMKIFKIFIECNFDPKDLYI